MIRPSLTAQAAFRVEGRRRCGRRQRHAGQKPQRRARPERLPEADGRPAAGTEPAGTGQQQRIHQRDRAVHPGRAGDQPGQRQRALQRRAADRAHRLLRDGASGETQATGTVQSVQSTLPGTTVTVEGVPGVKVASDHGSRLSPISNNPALVPPGGLTAPSAPAGGAGRGDGRDALKAPAGAPRLGKSSPRRLTPGGGGIAGRPAAAAVLPPRARAPPAPWHRAQQHTLGRLSRRRRPRRRARARATPSCLSTAPRSWWPSATARS